jgi:hypothetical protein
VCFVRLQADSSVMQRYLLQPVQQLEQRLQQQQLQVGSKEGLKALVDALFAVGKVRRLFCRFDVHISALLALLRQLWPLRRPLCCHKLLFSQPICPLVEVSTHLLLPLLPFACNYLQHEHQLRALQGTLEEPVIKRSNWDKARSDMAIAAQLALHRRQLHALVEEDEQHLSDSNNSQWTRHDLNKRMRGEWGGACC